VFLFERMSIYDTARANMIESQLRPNKVTDERVTDAFSRLRRELFVPEHLRGVAYVDEDLPLGRGRYLMEPMVAARLLQALMPGPKETALVVGAGVGYEAALLALLTRNVVALEPDEELARFGRAALVDHRIATVRPHPVRWCRRRNSLGYRGAACGRRPLGRGSAPRPRGRSCYSRDTYWRSARATRYLRRCDAVTPGFCPEACFCVLRVRCRSRGGAKDSDGCAWGQPRR
jgi:Protein-L-isoaspartate(D-aspartate) O-methyltransferase (PCMT)